MLSHKIQRRNSSIQYLIFSFPRRSSSWPSSSPPPLPSASRGTQCWRRGEGSTRRRRRWRVSNEKKSDYIQREYLNHPLFAGFPTLSATYPLGPNWTKFALGTYGTRPCLYVYGDCPVNFELETYLDICFSFSIYVFANLFPFKGNY